MLFIASASPRTFSQEYSLQESLSTPFGIATDGQGNVWFAEAGANKLGEISYFGPASRRSTSHVSRITGGVTVEKSGTVWITLPNLNEIASYSGGNFQFYNLTGLASLPTGIFADR